MKKITLIIFFSVVTSITVVQAQSVLDVNYGTLMNEINNNPARASQLYHNKTIRTTIVVDMVTSGTQVMAGGSAVLYVNFASSERSKVANLNKGQRITVRGVYDGNSLFPNIQRAVIETSPQSQPQQNQQPQAQQQPAQPQQQQNEPPNPMEISGTWKEKGGLFGILEGDSTITIKDIEFRFYNKNGPNFAPQTIVKIMVGNNIGGNSRDFPFGYTLTFSNGGQKQVFLHKNKLEIWYEGKIYVKQ